MPIPDDGTWSIKVGKKAAGRLLDGRTWDEVPEVLGI
jgi:protein gp37